jgi:hypothetical protein
MIENFPEWLDVKSKDISSEDGPVQRLQERLHELFPEIAEIVGLVVDGKYGRETQILVAIAQQSAKVTHQVAWDFEVDGHFGPSTRKIEMLTGLDKKPFPPGCGCMYMSPNFTEPLRWDPPTQETLVVADGV